MGLNFRKSITLFKGVKLNLSKSGPSLSFGRSGLRQSINLKGQARTSVGIPGTGIYYTKNTNVKTLAKKGKEKLEELTSKKKGKGEEQAALPAAAGTAAAAKGAKTTRAAAAKAAPAVNPDLERNRQLVAEFEERINAVKSVHKQSDGYIDWEVILKGAGNNKELVPFAESVLAGNIDSYFKVIAEAGPFDDLLEFGSGFEVGTDDPSMLEIEFKVMSSEVIPQNKLSLKANGDLAEKPFTKSEYYELVQDYVASTILRVARDSFALLPIQKVIIHAVDSQLNTATGNEEEITIVSVKIKRDSLMTINFERIDPSDCLGGFEINEKFKKTSGFAPVDRLLPD
ncbi:MAG: DUF4236 domain-containing protein [Clostridiales bacterium]|nr:DUF4236 domain-containing protein [Clostridiales bacterium]